LAGEDGELQVEATGETVGEAKWQALRQLESLAPGLDRATVRFQVVAEGERGLLGVGYAPARVVATAQTRRRSEPSAPAPDSEGASAEAELSRAVVERIAAALGADARVAVSEDDTVVTVTCSGPDLGILIGRHGATIDAIQYLANAASFRRFPDAKEVVVDASGYRARRRVALHALADESAEKALAEQTRVVLEPMTAVERKVVHLRLQDVPGIATASEGTEPYRSVVVFPAPG
jgi:spoIIIJ-associated protein